MMIDRSLSYFHQNADPSRITFAREFRGFTKKELAEKIGKTSSTLTLYENNKISVNIDTFKAICKELDFPPSFFLDKNREVPNGSLGLCHFRINKKVPQRIRIKAFSYAKLVISIFSYLEENGIVFPKDSVPYYDQDDTTEYQMEDAALKIRCAIGLGVGPILDMAKLLEGLGVRVIILPAEEKLDGFATWIDGVPCVVIDSESPASRMQFSYAHEFAHLIFDENSLVDDGSVERKANKFAGAFLMPAESFSIECPSYYRASNFLNIKQHWHVSISAAVYRARQLGKLSENSYRHAMCLLNKNGERTHEEGEFDKPLPSLLNKAMELIYRELTMDDMAKDLNIHEDELETVLLLQNVSKNIISEMKPKKKKATVFDFSVRKMHK